ncbi:DNA-binding CsgD family transcriptional regulator [Paenibacillus sp. PastF-1]|nr:DNA-binding CsgD family transcriptional regulator [Paenibacillus sp. PastF-2]MDF9851302.1 DNA-binding CsgD family transcriptional regulator [Paenibacillus sp. PastM-2]MDF9857885.1 DNA-binding CsgD family transcriptional regulator [Paenibacillus sp. PastF-1]MDH6483151.1 DNA-binding CsgD family transcriptional regulator [Paenibacillus sp. PastH-2]MDH6510592.1 DNA-binding CsgD family transcriptional regulator [Paenibacillus sp. PastM-3]
MNTGVPDSLMGEMQQLQDMFAAAMDQAIMLTDREGVMITRPAAAGRHYREMLDSLQDSFRTNGQVLQQLEGLADPAVMEWVPGLNIVVTPLAAGYGRMYYLWAGFYMERGTREQVLTVFEDRMREHPAYEQLRAGLGELPELGRERIAELRKSIAALGSIICRLLCPAQLGREGALRLKEAAAQLQHAGSLQELGTLLLDVVTGLPVLLSSVLVHFQTGEHAAHTYYARGWTPESGEDYVSDLEARYTPQAFLSSAIIREAEAKQILLECPLLSGNEFKGVLSVGFRQRGEAEQWMIQLETIAAMAGAAIRLIERDSRYSRQSEVFLTNFRDFLQNNNAQLYYLSLDASELAHDFARYMGRPEAEAELLKRACLLAPFRSDLLSEYGFFHWEIELIEKVGRLRLQHPAEDKQGLPLTAELLLLVLRHMSGQSDREQLAGQPHKWIDPSRFILEPDATDAVEDEPLSLFQQFLRSRTDSRPKKRVVNGSRLLDSAALTLSKEEWGISPREEEVLELIVHGKTNKEIASALFISEHTVKNHLSRIFNKMNVTDRSQIIALIYKRILNSERIEI